MWGAFKPRLSLKFVTDEELGINLGLKTKDRIINQGYVWDLKTFKHILGILRKNVYVCFLFL